MGILCQFRRFYTAISGLGVVQPQYIDKIGCKKAVAFLPQLRLVGRVFAQILRTKWELVFPRGITSVPVLYPTNAGIREALPPRGQGRGQGHQPALPPMYQGDGRYLLDAEAGIY